MQSLREKLLQTSNFLYGVELVSIRGSMAEKSAIKARTFANQLVDFDQVDWVSITDNAGGNPQLAAQALGKPILYAGKEVIIHLTCKDLNRNGLESEAWFLNSEGFHNILAMTGDYPISGNEGMAKPVFDIDSVGLIAMLNKMNNGFDLHPKNLNSVRQLEKTNFLIGAVTTNFKLHEGEVMPQYFKLQKKVECGARFIINQVGFDSRKIHELRLYMDQHGMHQTPLIGNVYLLNRRVASLFHDGKIPGVVVTPELLDVCMKQSRSSDMGRSFFYEFAAKQIAIYKGLGFRGAYLGGAYSLEAINAILDIEKSFSKDDWTLFASEISYSRPGEFYFYPKNPSTGLADPLKDKSVPEFSGITKHNSFTYRLARWTHDRMFAPGKWISEWGKKLVRKSRDPNQGPGFMRKIEILSKGILFDCKDCGDCSLPNIAFLCPESQCAKNQRNGPCGGTHEGKCEVDGYGNCIWLRAYERMKHAGKENDLLKHAPMIQNQGLRYTSAWANFWLGLDHSAKENNNIFIDEKMKKLDSENTNDKNSVGEKSMQTLNKNQIYPTRKKIRS